MAQGDNFQFGVAVNIRNHKFRRPTLFTSTVVSVATNVLTINNAFNNTNKKVKVGDRVNVANSTGQSENRKITAITDPGSSQTTLTCDSNFALTYAAADTVIIKGTRLAGAWTRQGTGAEDTLINPIDIKPHGGGASDDYAQVMRIGDNQLANQGIVQSISRLEGFRYYRMGVKWKGDFDNISGGAPTLSMVLTDPTSSFSETISSTDQFTWQRFTSNPLFVGAAGAGTLAFQISGLSTQNAATAFLDDVFLEHAAGVESAARIKSFVNAGGGQYQITIFGEIGTGVGQFNVSFGDEVAVDNGTNFIKLTVNAASGSVVTATSFSGTASAIAADSRIQKKSNGFVTLIDTPEMSSIQYDKIRSDRLSQLSDGSLKHFDPMSSGHASERWRFSCRFLGVSQSNFDRMQALLRHQQNGSLISFHPFIDDLPHVLIGKLFLTNYQKQFLFDLPSHDFTLRFEEMSI